MVFEHPQFLALLLLLPIIVGLWIWRGRRIITSALVLRLVAIALVVVALAHPTPGRNISVTGPLVILADQSDSLTAQGQQAARSEAENLVTTINQQQGNEPQQTAVFWFGGRALTPGEQPGSDPAGAPSPALVEAFNPAASDIGGALRTSRELLSPAGQTSDAEAGHVVLISDGRQTRGDALAEARLAAEAGLRVDVLPIEMPESPELRITHLDVPRTLREGEEYTVQVMIDNSAPEGQPTATEATLRLFEGDTVLGDEQIQLQPGTNMFSFDTRAPAAGVVQLRAEISGGPDTYERNNHAAAAALVTPPPRVLLVEGRAGAGQSLASALWNAGVESEVIPADMIPTRLSQLQSFDGMVLVDVPANDLTFDQMTTVQQFVRSEGRGLVATGGPNSFGLGGYDNTPLEQVLPLDMEAPPRPDRSDVALLLIIDRSASMDTAIGVSKFDMAKEAATLAVETLNDEDTIGVLAFDTGQEWTVPFQRIGQGLGLQQIKDSIATLPTGGGTDIYRALSTGLGELRQINTDVRHVVLLTDGRSFTDDRVAYQQLAESALNEEITISTIAIGFDSDTELLDNIAQWGGGRYYFADDPEDIPKLTLQESEIARSDPSVEGTFNANLAEPHPLLRTFAPNELPALEGYVATTAKENAEVVLVAPEDDPVLASWQYGLGRAVAWTPSAAEPWASGWLNWEDYGKFWAQVVRYTLPEANSSQLQVHLEPQPSGARLIADAIHVNGEPLDLASAVAQVTLPDGTNRTLNLRQVAPGRYAQDLLLPTDGAYGVIVVLERNGQQYRAETGYVQSTPDEYAPPEASSDTLQGLPLLEEIAAITGGEVLEQSSGLDVADSSPEDSASESYNPWSDLWKWLLGAALLVWLLEIAVRRGLFSRDS